jgi:putative metalloprotease
VRLLEKLQQMSGVGGGAPVWLMSHPRTPDRIAAIRALEHGWRPADR